MFTQLKLSEIYLFYEQNVLLINGEIGFAESLRIKYAFFF